MFRRMQSLVQGRPVSLEEGICDATDWDIVKKVSKRNQPRGTLFIRPPSSQIYKLSQGHIPNISMQEIVISTVAMKSVMS